MKKIGVFLLLHLALFVYSLESVASKFASQEDFLSFKYILFMGLLFVFLVIYAILWQQVLKHMNLTFAYANKGVTLVWGTLIGFLLFKEKVTLFNIIGIIVILIGITVMIVGENKHD